MDEEADLVERLRDQLRRDASDSDVAFLLTLAVRTPLFVYRAERDRLRRLAGTGSRSTTRELLLTEAAEMLLAQPTPNSGFRRPASGPIEVVEGPRTDAARRAIGDDELPRPKRRLPQDD